MKLLFLLFLIITTSALADVSDGDESMTAETRNTSSIMICNGRLTLSTNNPIPTTDVTAATTVYFTPYQGNRITLYSGTVWQLFTFSQISVAVPSTTTTPFDVFAYNNNGTVTLETVNWTDGTTRATALTTQDGVAVKSGATTRRYLGTGRTTSVSGQSEDSSKKRLLWNQCNRVPRFMISFDGTDTWSNNGNGTWTALNGGNSAWTHEFVLGQSVEPVTSDATVYVGVNGHVAIGLDSTSAIDRTKTTIAGPPNVAGLNGLNSTAKFFAYLSEGYHYLQGLQTSYQAGAVTFAGDNGGSVGGGSYGVNSGMLTKIFN